MEREVAATRTGRNRPRRRGCTGDVPQVWSPRRSITTTAGAGDPHLHTHVVISNKVQTVPRWQMAVAWMGLLMHAAVVALSELHEAVFADHLTRSFGRLRGRRATWAATATPRGDPPRCPRRW